MRRRQQGNIVLTALFIAFFLFFLSVALIWTNRQDIALSLSMEHKLRARSAARSGAYEAFAWLREYGDLHKFTGKKFPGGAEVKVTLERRVATSKRGELLLIRSHGRSGPVSSYLTFHLLDVSIAGEENREKPRVLFLWQKREEDETAAETETTTESDGVAGYRTKKRVRVEESSSTGSSNEEKKTSKGTGAIYGDFILRGGGAGIGEGMVARGGPVFSVEEVEDLPPPAFLDYIPVYSEDRLQLFGWGPTFVVTPEAPGTVLRHLTYKDEAFGWVEIDPPDDLGNEEPANASEVFRMEVKLKDWTVASIYGIGPSVVDRAWVEPEPPTRYASDIEGAIGYGTPQEPGVLVEWDNRGPVVSPQHKFVTRGAIAAHEDSVYSHGWHYLYRPYKKGVPPEVTAVDGAILTRWPCLLRYTIDKGWEKVWSPLNDDGTVATTVRPDASVLAVSDTGKIFMVTEPNLAKGIQRRLLTVIDQKLDVGDFIPEGELIVYKEEPYLIPTNPIGSHILNFGAGKDIDFSSLPDELPEIYGELVDVTDTKHVLIGLPGGNAGQALDSSKMLAYTARPGYKFTYSIPADGPTAVEGDDIWTTIRVQVEIDEPSNEPGYVDPPFEEGIYETLARYDGENWHILPHGLRALLRDPNLQSTAEGVVSAVYEGLPEPINRYTIVGVDTKAF